MTDQAKKEAHDVERDTATASTTTAATTPAALDAVASSKSGNAVPRASTSVCDGDQSLDASTLQHDKKNNKQGRKQHQQQQQQQEKDGHKPAATDATPRRRPTGFQPGHALKFALEVVAHEEHSQEVAVVLCLFCKHFGREERVGAKRRATTNFKYFKRAFRTDQYLQHHRLQHPTRWAAYESASLQQKRAFFPHHLQRASPQLVAATADGDANGDGSVLARCKRNKAANFYGEDEEAEVIEGSRLDGDVNQKSDGSDLSRLQFVVPHKVVALFVVDAGVPWNPLALSECVVLAHAEENQREKEVATNVKDDEEDGGDEQDASSKSKSKSKAEAEGKAEGRAIQGKRAVAEHDYRVKIVDRQAFDLMLDLCAAGLSPRQITQSLHVMAGRVAALHRLVVIWEDFVLDHVTLGCMASMAMLATLLPSTWAFSLALRGPKQPQARDRIDVRVRFWYTELQEFHLVRVRHDELSQVVAKVLDALHPRWRQALLGIVMHGDVMQPAVGSAVRDVGVWNESVLASEIKTLTSVCMHPVRVLWVGETLVVHALQQMYRQLEGGAFAMQMGALLAYLATRSDLTQDIGHAPQQRGGVEIAATVRWLMEKRIRIRKYMDEHHTSCGTRRPSHAWWLSLAVFDWLASHSSEIVRKLASIHDNSGNSDTANSNQDRRSLPEQISLVTELVNDCRTTFRAEGEANTMDQTTLSDDSVNDSISPSIHRPCIVKPSAMREFTGELGAFVCSLILAIPRDEYSADLEMMADAITVFIETLFVGVKDAQACCTDASDERERRADVPPIFPHELARLSSKEFTALVDGYRTQLTQFFSEEDMDHLEQQYQFLKRSYRDKELRAILTEASESKWSFDRCWASTHGRFRVLHAFVGGLATLHSTPSTGTEENPTGSDMINSQHDPMEPPIDGGVRGGPGIAAHRDAVLCIKSEAPLHAAQFHRLEALGHQSHLI